MKGRAKKWGYLLTGAGSEQEVGFLWNYIRTSHKCVRSHDGMDQGGLDPGGKTPDPRLETKGRQNLPKAVVRCQVD